MQKMLRYYISEWNLIIFSFFLQRGRPPYPLEKNLSVDEVEYVTRWLDYYQANRSEDGVSNLGEIVGYLAEYREQQESGESDFKLPPIPT